MKMMATTIGYGLMWQLSHPEMQPNKSGKYTDHFYKI